MLPNVRLTIVAILASIMGIGCALALFAEFRVSRDSFLRESNAGVPLQLGSGSVTPVVVMNTVAALGPHIQTGPPPFGRSRAQTTTSDRAAEIGPASPPQATVPPPPEPATPSVATTNASKPTATAAPAIGPAPPPGLPVADPAATVITTSAPEAAAVASAPASAPAVPISVAVTAVPTRVGTRQSPKPDSAAAIATQTPPSSQPISTKPAPKPAAQRLRVKPAETKAPVVRHRVATVRHVRKRAVVRLQPPGADNAAIQPQYQWAFPTPQPPARRRVVNRRTRPVPNAGASTVPQSTAATVWNPTAAPQ